MDDKRYDDVPVYTTRLANILLKLNYKIVNLAENNSDKGRTVFFFENKEGIREDIKKHSSKW